jgi:hypothetical protein
METGFFIVEDSKTNNFFIPMDFSPNFRNGFDITFFQLKNA